MTTTNTVCTLCGATMADAGYLCARCVDRVVFDLDEIADSWHGIAHAASGLARRRGITSGGAGVTDGIPTAAIDAKDAVRNAVGTILRDLVEDSRIPDIEGAGRLSVPDVARHLAQHAGGLRRHPWAASIATEIASTRRHLEAVVEPPPGRKPDLGAGLADREAELIEQWLAISRAAEVLPFLRLRPPSEATLRAWAGQTGRPAILFLDGGKIRLGSVLEILDTRRATRPRMGGTGQGGVLV